MLKLKIFALAGGLIVGGPAIAADGHCYTMGAAQLIVPDLFNKNPGSIKLGMTAERVELGGEFPDEPGTCYVEIMTNTGLLMKYKFRYDGATGIATMDLIRADERAATSKERPAAAGKDCSGIAMESRTLDCAPP
jgi:hypothetical protein